MQKLSKRNRLIYEILGEDLFFKCCDFGFIIIEKEYYKRLVATSRAVKKLAPIRLNRKGRRDRSHHPKHHNHSHLNKRRLRLWRRWDTFRKVYHLQKVRKEANCEAV